MHPRCLLFTVSSLFVLSWMYHGVPADQCPAQEPIYGKALKGYTFKSLLNTSAFECLYHCHYETRCQSYNYVMKENVCEMNNRTKEAKPQHFVSDPDRLYNKRGAHRVNLGATPLLPADSCKEIQASEGGDAVSGNWWLDPTSSGEAILVYCDMDAGVADFCIRNRCQNGATCVNGHVNYTCLCEGEWTGNYCESTLNTEPPSAVSCVSVTRLVPTDTYEINADHGSFSSHGFCRVIRKGQINAGKPYTLIVDLLNVIGQNDVGHLGAMYNVIDETNFDLVFFRPHTPRCCQLGYVLNGSYVETTSYYCPSGPPLNKVWFAVRVVVGSDKSVNVFLNDALVTSSTAHYDTRGRGGVLAANGYQNIIQFREFSLCC